MVRRAKRKTLRRRAKKTAHHVRPITSLTRKLQKHEERIYSLEHSVIDLAEAIKHKL